MLFPPPFYYALLLPTKDTTAEFMLFCSYEPQKTGSLGLVQTAVLEPFDCFHNSSPSILVTPPHWKITTSTARLTSSDVYFLTTKECTGTSTSCIILAQRPQPPITNFAQGYMYMYYTKNQASPPIAFTSKAFCKQKCDVYVVVVVAPSQDYIKSTLPFVGWATGSNFTIHKSNMRPLPMHIV